MSPTNRVNPDISVAEGRFGWDVIPGYYKVRAATALCDAESMVLTIPPAVTELPVVLHCSSLCANGPAPTCRSAGKASLQIADSASDDGKDKLSWKWTEGAATTPGELGIPDSTTAYSLCVYTADGTDLFFETYVPASSSKWRPAGSSGYKYKDSTATASGAQKISLKAGDANKAKMSLRAGGANLADPTLGNLTLPVVVTLVNSETSACFMSRFNGAGVLENTTAEFKAKGP
jgi:hypothetical protein